MNQINELTEFKKSKLRSTAEFSHRMQLEHPMRQLFLELTTRCNLSCIHCGSDCETAGSDLALCDIEKILQEVCSDARAHGSKPPFIVLTGGEPMLHREFYKIPELLQRYGLKWGMTTNATMINVDAVTKMQIYPPYSISVSLDDVEEAHDCFRQTPGAYRKAMHGIECLIDAQLCRHLMITTVLTHESLARLDAIYAQILPLEIDSWRIVPIEPVGRAAARQELLFTSADYIHLFDFIREQRRQQIPVITGCAHYLGLDYERDLRDWYFRCQAGTTVCSVMANGDIGACLDIPRNGQTIQGNIYQDSLMDVWNHRFQIFRTDLADSTEGCLNCEHRLYCRGGSHHTYDHKNHRQNLCLKDKIF